MILHGEGFTLRKFKASDINDDYIGWLNDNEHMKYSNQKNLVHNEETCSLFLKSFENSNNYFLAIINSNSDLVGTCTIYYDVYNHLANLGILVAPVKSNQGIGKSVFKILLTQLEFHLKLNKIVVGTCELNLKMISVIEKSGMQFEYRAPREFLSNGEYVDNLMYAKYY